MRVLTFRPVRVSCTYCLSADPADLFVSLFQEQWLTGGWGENVCVFVRETRGCWWARGDLCVSEQVYMCVRGIYESGTNASMPRWQSPSRRPDVKGQVVSERRSSSFIIQGPDWQKKKKKTPQRHTLSWLCANLLNAWKNTGNPVLYHTLKRKEIWFTLVNQRQHSDRGLTGINGSRRTMSPRHHNKSFSLLHRQTHPHDVLGWAEEFPSLSYKYFSMNTVRPVADDVIKMNSVTLKYASFFFFPSKQAVTTYH